MVGRLLSDWMVEIQGNRNWWVSKRKLWPLLTHNLETAILVIVTRRSESSVSKRMLIRDSSEQVYRKYRKSRNNLHGHQQVKLVSWSDFEEWNVTWQQQEKEAPDWHVQATPWSPGETPAPAGTLGMVLSLLVGLITPHTHVSKALSCIFKMSMASW